jgi:hypothetical protein
VIGSIRAGLAADIAAKRAAQAERILAALEELPQGASLYIDRTYDGIVATVFSGGDRTRCRGSSVRDALGQLSAVLTLNGEG